jgi:hypothetical protein
VAALVADDGNEATGGPGEPWKIAEEQKARLRRGEPVRPRRAPIPSAWFSARPPGLAAEPSSEAPGCARTWGAGRVGRSCWWPEVPSNNPCFSFSVSVCVLCLVLLPAPRKQEENGPERSRAQQPPSDHAPVRGADFEGNLSRTAWV